MAYRFTDTEKWKKPFFKALPAAYKLLWNYICDECNHAGIWQVDIEVAQIRIGETITTEIALKFFKDKVVEIDGGEKWFIPSFIEFQYPGGLKETNKAHSGIIKILNKYDLLKNQNKGLGSPFEGAKEYSIKNKEERRKIEEGTGGDFFAPLDETETLLTIEFISMVHLSRVILTAERVASYWEAFLTVKNKFYASRPDVVQHFRNWLKLQKLSHDTTKRITTEIAERDKAYAKGL